MKKYSVIFILIFFSNFVSAQRAAVDRKTGLKIACAELDCEEDDSTYSYTERDCLNCFYERSDSTMNALFQNLIQHYDSRKKSTAELVKEQKLWRNKSNNLALIESEKYKGGTMEITEYLKMKLILTNKRIIFLQKKLKSST